MSLTTSSTSRSFHSDQPTLVVIHPAPLSSEKRHSLRPVPLNTAGIKVVSIDSTVLPILTFIGKPPLHRVCKLWNSKPIKVRLEHTLREAAQRLLGYEIDHTEPLQRLFQRIVTDYHSCLFRYEMRVHREAKIDEEVKHNAISQEANAISNRIPHGIKGLIPCTPPLTVLFKFDPELLESKINGLNELKKTTPNLQAIAVADLTSHKYFDKILERFPYPVFHPHFPLSLTTRKFQHISRPLVLDLCDRINTFVRNNVGELNYSSSNFDFLYLIIDLRFNSSKYFTSSIKSDNTYHVLDKDQWTYVLLTFTNFIIESNSDGKLFRDYEKKLNQILKLVLENDEDKKKLKDDLKLYLAHIQSDKVKSTKDIDNLPNYISKTARILKILKKHKLIDPDNSRRCIIC